MKVGQLYWDAITIDTLIDSDIVKPNVFVFWPSPVDPDPCFAKAGFAEFAPVDVLWKQTWRHCVQASIQYLSQFGAPLLRNPILKTTLLDRLKKLIRPFTHYNYQDPSLTDLVNLCSRQDGHPAAIIDFGDLHGLTLMTADGHPILWVLVDSRIRFSPEHMANTIAPGVPVERRSLDWVYLLPGKARHGSSGSMPA